MKFMQWVSFWRSLKGVTSEESGESGESEVGATWVASYIINRLCFVFCSEIYLEFSNNFYIIYNYIIIKYIFINLI